LVSLVEAEGFVPLAANGGFMMSQALCEICGERPATSTIRRISPGSDPVTQQVCDRCLRQQTGSSAIGGLGMFDDLFSGFFDEPMTFGGRGRSGRATNGRRRQMERVDVTQFFSKATNDAIEQAAKNAVAWGAEEIDTPHLLHAVLKQEIVRHILERMDVKPDQIAGELEQEYRGGASTDAAEIDLSPGAKRALLRAYEESQETGSSHVGPEHVLLALADDPESEAGKTLRKFAVSHAKLRGGVATGVDATGKAKAQSTTPTLDEYGRDLTAAAREGKIDPVIGRGDEIEQTVEILSRRTKNNPVLIGEPGVGKTAIVEGIAQRIVNNEVPETLADRRLIALDLAGMVAGTKYRGEFEERLKNVIREIQANSESLILFLDELHTVVGAGGAEGAIDASNMLKPALARGELHVIGATTLDEYRKYIAKDAALERRFQPVLVPEPTVEQTIAILLGLRDKYEAYHRVKISDEAITAAADLSDKYIADRFLPDKAIDLVDQAAARVRLRSKTPSDDRRGAEEGLRKLEREKAQAVAGEDFTRADELKRDIERRQEELRAGKNGHGSYPTVTAEDIAEVVSRATGIPVSRLTEEERSRLLKLEDLLHQRVIGQDEAVEAVSEAIRRARSGLGDPNRPIGSFLFLGPTGVGKTELAKTLAEAMFGDEDMIIRFDMSEFQERHTVSRLVGAPPGYVGYDEAGQLTEAVRRKPYAVLLLDEIEKAHQDVFNILLQILDDGRLTDAQGRTINFKNTVVIMTSNIGAERILMSAKRKESFDKLRDDLLEMLKQLLRPEFLNRIDEIIVFRALEEAQIKDIARLILERVARRMRAQRINVEFTEDAVSFVAQEGFDPQFGARPLKRAVQRLIENELSKRVLQRSVNPGDTVVVDCKDNELEVRVTTTEEKVAAPA
jgi:ATP-dependent Clp protease ATP-binding subunit ClpC